MLAVNLIQFTLIQQVLVAMCSITPQTSLSGTFRQEERCRNQCLEFGFQSECTWSRVMLFHAVIHIGIHDSQLAHVFKLNIKQALHLF